ncbi:MAG: hypothetical protein DRJ13_07770, partial [Bacteroidetes bacterium]
MKRIVLLLSIIALLFSFQEIHSQSLRDRVKKVVFKEKKEAPAETDSTTNDEPEESVESATNNFTNKVMMNALGLPGNVEYESDYNFDAHIQIENSKYKKNGTLNNQMLYESYTHNKNANY